MTKQIISIVLALINLVTSVPDNIPQNSAFWQPSENYSMDYANPESKWSFDRCRETEHFYIFWEKGFGSDPGATTVPENMRVDISDLAQKLEQFWQTETQSLGFADTLDVNGYKMQVYLLYQDDWVATGSGYDDTIGALWITPMTCLPVGSVIAHEVGHCFQYMVSCRQNAEGTDITQSGFRYGYPGSDGGNAFWELCAQWQSWQDYPAEMFTDYEMETWFSNYFRSLENEWTRYQNYWILYYITQKHGTDALLRIWTESRYPEDALSTYARLYLDNDLNALYSELYDYAVHCATFDFTAAQNYSESWQGYYNTKLIETSGGWLQVAYENCPEANGFNEVPLSPEAGKVTVQFKGLKPGSKLAKGDSGTYHTGDDPTVAGTVKTYNKYSGEMGWRYGFVALKSDGTRVYSPMYSDTSATVTFDVPDDTYLVYFVVLGAPEEYACHAWDNTELTDVQAPYKIKIS